MKGFFVFLLFVVFFFSFQLTVFSFFTNNTLKVENVKEKLNSSNIYKTAAESLQKIEPDPDTQADQKEVFSILKKEITQDYIKTKAEGLILSVSNWVEGKNNVSPQLDLTDLKAKITKDFPDKPLPPELDKVLSRPIEIKTNSTVEGVKDGFHLFRNSFIVSLLVSLGALVGIFFLATSRKSGLHGVSLALFLSCVSGAFLSVVVFFGINLAFNFALGSLGDSEFNQFTKPLQSFLNPILGTLSLQILATFFVGLVFSLLIFLGSVFIKEEKS